MKTKTAVGLFLVLVLVSGLVTFLNLNAQSPRISPAEITTRQLSRVEGMIPVEIIRPGGTLLDEKSVAGLEFVVRNNSRRNVTAFCLAYALSIERNGAVTVDTFYRNVTALVHKDITEAKGDTSIRPGAETKVTDNAKTWYEPGSKIQGVEVALDFVEFDDGSVLGSNIRGAEMTSQIRRGAEAYKEALVNQLKPTDLGSIAGIIESVASGELPPELASQSSDFRLGAKLYRDHVRRILDRNGIDGLPEYLLGKTRPR